MRMKNPQSLLCFCAFIQVTLTYHKNEDNLQNGQRANPKKYYPTSTGGVHFNRRHSDQSVLDSVQSSAFLRMNSVSRTSDEKRYSSSGHPVRHRHGWLGRGGTTTMTTTTTTTTTPSPDDEELFDKYGELYDSDDQTEDDYSDDIFGSTNNDFYDEFQSEEPAPSTETSREKPTPEPQLSPFGKMKFEQLGTRANVTKAMQNHYQLNGATSKKKSSRETTNSVAEANEHYARVAKTGECKRPILKVIPVQLEHPNPSVAYIPHCTVLHRCADDTGCCRTDDSTCQYKEREEVTLYFYIRKFGINYASVEKLTFYNHTECECKDKFPREEPPTTERVRRVPINWSRSAGPVRADNVPETLMKKCKCPKEFVPQIKFGTKCYCDCDLSNEDCMRMKKGHEYSSLNDRLCIQNRECGTVLCQYGAYNKLKGRCPKYEES